MTAARIRLGGLDYPLIYDIGALRALGDAIAAECRGFDWIPDAAKQLAGGNVETLAAFLHAGLLRVFPDLNLSEAMDLIDGATWLEFADLPQQVFDAFQSFLPDDREARDSGGDPWDWDKAVAVWVAEWGRPEAEFYATTLRSYASIGRGLAALYDKSKTGADAAQQQGYSLQELLNMGRRKR